MAGEIWEVLRALSEKRHTGHVIGVRMSPEYKRRLDADARENFGIVGGTCETGTCHINVVKTIGGTRIYVDDSTEGFLVEVIPFD